MLHRLCQWNLSSKCLKELIPSVLGADPRLLYWGVDQTLVQKRLLNFFVAYYLSQNRPRVSQSVRAGRRWRGKYCLASRGKQIIGGYRKTITVLRIPGI